MIYLFYGQNGAEARKKANDVVASLLKKRPDASFFRLESDNWQDASFDEYVAGQGLFSQKYIVLLDKLFENKEIKEYVIQRLKDLKSSENIFIILEGSLDKATLSKLEKSSEKVQIFGEKDLCAVTAKLNAEKTNFFAMADALGSRNSKLLWSMYQRAVREEMVPEEIHGILFWQIKSILLAVLSKGAKESGLNPFVYSKAKNFGRNFTLDELKKISFQLVQIYHQAHRGEVDFTSALEKFILKI